MAADGDRRGGTGQQGPRRPRRKAIEVIHREGVDADRPEDYRYTDDELAERFMIHGGLDERAARAMVRDIRDTPHKVTRPRREPGDETPGTS